MTVAMIVLGVVFAVNAVVVTIASHWHAGVIATYAVAIVLLCGAFVAAHCGKYGNAVRMTALVCVGVACVGITALFVGGITDTVRKEDAVIVLGAGLVGEKPSRTLADRLQVAADYHREHPDAVIVVSGGQGANEDISEALAMKRWLVSHGVAESAVLMEDRSTSTAENFAFSKVILDKHFEGAYTVAFVTSDFHVFRAGHIAKEAGFSDARHAHSDTPWYAVIPNGLREMMAVVKTWLFD